MSENDKDHLSQSNQSQNDVENKKPNKKQSKKAFFKKMIKNPLVVCGSIIFISVVGAGVHYYTNGGSVGIDHKIANKTYVQKKQEAQEQSVATFKEHKTDSFPTIEEVQKRLKSEFNTNNLTSVSLNKLNSKFIQIWGKSAYSAMVTGHLLSNSMSPDDADQAEVNLAQSMGTTKDFVGFPTETTQTDIYTSGYKTQNNTKYFGPLYSYSNNIVWNDLGGIDISQPFISATQSNVILTGGKSKPKMSTMIIFVKPQAEVSWKTIVSKMSSLKITVDKESVKLSGNNSKTYLSDQGIYGKGNGLQLAKFTGSNFNESDNIFPNSVIPICFDVPFKDSKSSSYFVSIPKTSSYLLKLNMKDNINFHG